MRSRTLLLAFTIGLLGVFAPTTVAEAAQAQPAPVPALPTSHDQAAAAEAGRQAGPQQPNRRSSGVAAAGAPVTEQAGQPPISFRVFATQYAPGTPGSVEVAVPDKCAKFAALQNSGVLAQFGCPAGYSLGLDWRVDVSRDSGQAARLPVKDVGPWNVDDNYWDPASGSLRPRRRFTDLPQGTPESQAAFYQGYNSVPNCLNLDGSPSGHAGGADGQGRCVLNPAGIDLSLAAAAQLGLSPGQNEWVNVTFRWEADPATLTNDPDDVRTPRVGLINGCSAGYVKGGPLTGPFRQQVGCNDARVLTLGGSRVGVINGCGAAYAKDGALSGPFNALVTCGDANALVVTADRVGVINGCGAAYVQEGGFGAPFHQQVNCGDARTVSLGGSAVDLPSRVGLINSCGGGYVKEGSLGGPFNQQLACGDARSVVVSSNRIGVINGCGAFYVKEGGLGGPFNQQTACGDARAIAVTNDRLAVINGCGALYVKDGSLGRPFDQQTACGDAAATAVAGNRVGVINGCGAAYVKEGPLSTPFRVQVSCGDARSLSLSSF